MPFSCGFYIKNKFYLKDRSIRQKEKLKFMWRYWCEFVTSWHGSRYTFWTLYLDILSELCLNYQTGKCIDCKHQVYPQSPTRKKINCTRKLIFYFKEIVDETSSGLWFEWVIHFSHFPFPQMMEIFFCFVMYQIDLRYFPTESLMHLKMALRDWLKICWRIL